MNLKWIGILTTLVILFTMILPITNTMALTNDQLMIINGKTIYKDTTISQLNNMFGTPVEQTETAFGGKACSYTNSDSTYYLYVETNSEGKIVSCGAINGNFQGKSYSQGDKYNNMISRLSGQALYDYDDSNKVYGVMDYHCTLEEENQYWENYKKDSAKYLYGLQKHAIIASKVLAKKNGIEFPQTYISEEIFYINEQLKYNNSSMYTYSKNAGKTEQISLIMTTTETYYEKLPNPISLAGKTENYARTSNYKYLLYDINITDYTTKKSKNEYLFIDPTFLEERKSVDLTSEEKNKLEAAKIEYEKYLKNLEIANSYPSLYDKEPNYSSIPLSAGKYKTVVLQTVTDFLNVARAGLGIRTLNLNEEIADCAQHKATLVYYMNSNNMSAGHYPTKPEGVSDEFYNKAQSYMNENLYHGTIQTSIMSALNDGYGDSTKCGHRYNLLNPGYTEWGIGAVGKGLSFGWQACHKLSGYKDFNNELVAWPSNGIMPIDLINGDIGNWTAFFYKNYAPTKDTEVTVKCLNTDKIYEITKENSGKNGKYLAITGNYLVTFRDDSITYEDGDVFEITLHNMKDSSGNITDYTYRSVFYKFYESSKQEIQDISLNKDSLTLIVGGSERILAKIIPEDASIKLMKFTSSDEGIAKVRQDGTITGIKPGKATITVKCGNISKTISVSVENFKKGDMDKNGEITAYDAFLVNLIYEEGRTPTDEEIQIGDIDGDGNLTAYDAYKINVAYENGTTL